MVNFERCILRCALAECSRACALLLFLATPRAYTRLALVPSLLAFFTYLLPFSRDSIGVNADRRPARARRTVTDNVLAGRKWQLRSTRSYKSSLWSFALPEVGLLEAAFHHFVMNLSESSSVSGNSTSFRSILSIALIPSHSICISAFERRFYYILSTKTQDVSWAIPVPSRYHPRLSQSVPVPSQYHILVSVSSRLVLVCTRTIPPRSEPSQSYYPRVSVTSYVRLGTIAGWYWSTT